MKNNTIIKLILISFFAVFFSFLFYYFYDPSDIQVEEGNQEENFFSNIFPFGGEKNNDVSSVDNTRNESGELTDPVVKEKEVMPRLRQISAIPTAAVHMQALSKLEIFDLNKDRKTFEKLDEETTISEIRYVAIKDSRVYQTYDFTSHEERISNVSVPKIVYADFFDKENFLIQYLSENDEIKTYSVNLTDKTEEEIEEEQKRKKSDVNRNLKKFQGVFFPDDIEDVYMYQDQVFYTTFVNTQKQKDGKLYGVITNKNSEDKREIFSSVLKEWNFSFNNEEVVIATTKNSGTTNSIAFSLNLEDGLFKKISRAELGLNAIPNYDLSRIVYSQRDEKGQYTLLVENTQTGQVDDLSVSTFVDKCVWSQNNTDLYCAVPLSIASSNQPDDWYKGKNYFVDDIVRIDTISGLREYVFNARAERKVFDIVDLKIDTEERFVYWKDKKTDFAWSYRI